MLRHMWVRCKHYMLIPKGIKSILWFSYYKDLYVAIIINLNKYNQFEDVKIYPTCFNEELIYKDTIFLGYEFTINNYNNILFSITDVYFYKGIQIFSLSYEKKFNIMKSFFKNDIRQISICKNSLIIGLPIILDNYKLIYNTINNNSYQVSSVLYIKKYNPKNFGISYHNIEENLEAVFKIKADIQNDIYNLYYKEENYDRFFNIALIKNYKSSVMMNKLFRNIKENNNLDLLEESDSDEEFENIELDKYVNLNKSVTMRCIFNSKFKKWYPVEVSKESIITKKELFNIIKK